MRPPADPGRSRLAWALELAGRGWPVFPLLPHSKRPALHGDSPTRPCPRTGQCADGHRGWEQLATTDPRLIEVDWTQHPDRNVGLACGPAGLIVIDLDVPKPGLDTGAAGVEAFADLARAHGGSIPATWTVRTPSGGQHRYYLAPPGQRLGTAHGKPTKLIDVRAHGGYVVAPGSALAAGAYELVDDSDPAVLPDWLLGLLLAEPVSVQVGKPVRIARPDTYLAAAVRDEVTSVRSAEPGQHNDTLYGAALRLGKLLAGVLRWAAAPRIDMGCDCTDAEILRVIGYGLRDGARKPRDLL